MKALITGASSGIGRDIAKELSKRGYDLVLVARDLEKLNKVKSEIKNTNIEIVGLDISTVENCKELYKNYRESLGGDEFVDELNDVYEDAIKYICLSFISFLPLFYFCYIYYFGSLIFCCQFVATSL